VAFANLLTEANLAPGKFLLCRYADLTPENVLDKHWLRAKELAAVELGTPEAELTALLTHPDLARARMSLLDDQPGS